MYAYIKVYGSTGRWGWYIRIRKGYNNETGFVATSDGRELFPSKSYRKYESLEELVAATGYNYKKMNFEAVLW